MVEAVKGFIHNEEEAAIETTANLNLQGLFNPNSQSTGA